MIENFGRGFRYLDEDAAVALIRHTVAMNRKDIFFGDDIFAANRARTTRLLERLLREGVRMPAWCAQVRVETAQDPELLKLMKRANCGMVCIGLESVNEETLKLYHKHSDLEKNRKAIEAFHRAGIRVHGMFVLGSDADTEQTLAETLKFARDTNLSTAQFFALTTAPGTPLARRLAEEKRIIAWGDWHLFDAQHAVVCPAQIDAFAASGRHLPPVPGILFGQRGLPPPVPRPQSLVQFCDSNSGKQAGAADRAGQ